jgi:oxygen-independent coproporphyrinogen-3 oxidase
MNAAREALALADKVDSPVHAASEDEPLALYVHWPFCVSKCPYCDFNSHVRASVDQQLWREALLRDLAHEAAMEPGRRLGSIFFGGGTPSLMPPETVATVIDAATRYWGIAGDIEITLEANPSSAEAERFAELAHAGVNRLSLGIQSLDEEALRFLGRAHGVAEALAAIDAAQAAVDRLSLDFIYALPGQSAEHWEAQLRRALGFGTSHLSLYQLTIEPGTRFAALAAKGALDEIDSDSAASLYELTQRVTQAAGLPAYETSNHARPGQESRHNLAYWRYQPYCGVGPGAHGRRGGHVTQRHRKPENWLRAVERGGHGIVEETVLQPRDKAVEALLMGLRLTEGVDLRRIGAISGEPMSDLVDGAALVQLERQGLVERTGPRLRVTAAGALLLDGILAEIVRLD